MKRFLYSLSLILIKMAKPIKATPTLVGKEADRFIERMIRVENSKITQEQKRETKEIIQNIKALIVC